MGADLKGKVSILLYAAAIAAAFLHQAISDALYVTVALMWLVPGPPDREAVRNGELKAERPLP